MENVQLLKSKIFPLQNSPQRVNTDIRLIIDSRNSERIMRNGDKKLIDKGHDERGTHSYRAGGAEPVRRSL